MAKWTTKDIPDQRGRVALVTGANGGLGFFIGAGAGRGGAPRCSWRAATKKKEKGAEALAHVKAEHPNAAGRAARASPG